MFGCKTQTIEYRTRPTWHTALAGGLPTERVRNDGTIVKYKKANETSSVAFQLYIDSIALEEEDEDTGEITLRAVLPEHILKHVLTCLRDRSWDLLYNQLISTKMKRYYDEREQGRKEFDAFFSTNRRELAKTLQRIHGGIGFGDVITTERNNIVIHTLSARIQRDYTFNSITFIRESQFLKLHAIE